MIKELDFKMELNKINELLNDATNGEFETINLQFDFKNDKITIGNKRTLKVEHSRDYVYKFMKTKVLATNGIEGLYKHIEEASQPKSLWNNRMYGTLKEALR